MALDLVLIPGRSFFSTSPNHQINNWMQLAQDRDQWWALVNTVMNLRVTSMAGNLLSSWVTISL